jgi:hypothetical protein
LQHTTSPIVDILESDQSLDCANKMPTLSRIHRSSLLTLKGICVSYVSVLGSPTSPDALRFPLDVRHPDPDHANSNVLCEMLSRGTSPKLFNYPATPSASTVRFGSHYPLLFPRRTPGTHKSAKVITLTSLHYTAPVENKSSRLVVIRGPICHMCLLSFRSPISPSYMFIPSAHSLLDQ